MTTEDITELLPEQALFELSMLNAEQLQIEFEEVVIEGMKRGIPAEILTRLKDLWEATQDIAGEIIAIGKIIVLAIIDFLKANPTLLAGMALGAAVSSLVLTVPFLGPLLLPLSMLISTLYGAGVGAAMQEGDYSASPITAAIALANKFFELLRLILKGISQYWKTQ
jgi:hypothetical protein